LSPLPSELGELIQQTRTIIDLFSKAKAAKIIRELVDLFLDMGAATGNEVCRWEGEEGRKWIEGGGREKEEEGRKEREIVAAGKDERVRRKEGQGREH